MPHPYFEKLIEVITNTVISEGYYIVDINFITIATDAHFLEYWGDPDLIGKRIRNSNSKYVYLADEYLKHSLDFLATNSRSTKKVGLIKNEAFTEFYDVLMSKVIDPETLSVIGIAFFYNRLWLDAGLIDVLSKSKSNVYSFYHESNLPDNLTLIEHEIIWLLVAGKSQKEIAFILSNLESNEVSRDRIAKIINRNLYPKFQVNDLAGLIAKIGSTPLMSSISTRLFNYFRKHR